MAWDKCLGVYGIPKPHNSALTCDLGLFFKKRGLASFCAWTAKIITICKLGPQILAPGPSLQTWPGKRPGGGVGGGVFFACFSVSGVSPSPAKRHDLALAGAPRPAGSVTGRGAPGGKMAATRHPSAPHTAPSPLPQVTSFRPNERDQSLGNAPGKQTHLLGVRLALFPVAQHIQEYHCLMHLGKGTAWPHRHPKKKRLICQGI